MWYQQQLFFFSIWKLIVVICLKISTFVVSTTTLHYTKWLRKRLWFAWKYLPLWYQQQQTFCRSRLRRGCDLLENIYLCGINNNSPSLCMKWPVVVICLKISTFVVSTTTNIFILISEFRLWFAWKYLPLWYQQQRPWLHIAFTDRCDLLENIYLCGTNNNFILYFHNLFMLWFAWKYLPLWYQQQLSLATILHRS